MAPNPMAITDVVVGRPADRMLLLNDRSESNTNPNCRLNSFVVAYYRNTFVIVFKELVLSSCFQLKFKEQKLSFGWLLVFCHPKFNWTLDNRVRELDMEGRSIEGNVEFSVIGAKVFQTDLNK